MSANVEMVIKAFGSPQCPEKITQEPFDYDPGHYGRLCSIDEKPLPVDLHSFADDLTYQALQPDLFLFLFPVCLQAWQQDLMATYISEYAGFVEQFSAAMTKHLGFGELLTSGQHQAVAEFMENAILDRIDKEEGLSFKGMNSIPYRWIYAIGTFGTVFPSVSRLWEKWWSVPSLGRAFGVLQYSSIFMYPEDANPVFSPWTRELGGGPPAPWEVDGHIYDRCWLPANVEFLRTELTTEFMRAAITKAAARLDGEADNHIVNQIVSDYDQLIPMVELRIEECIDYLARPLGKVHLWTTT